MENKVNIKKRLDCGERSEASWKQMPHFCLSNLLSSFTRLAVFKVINTLLSTFTHTHASARAYACETVYVRGVEKEERSRFDTRPTRRHRWPTFADRYLVGLVGRRASLFARRGQRVAHAASERVSSILRQQYDSEPVRFCSIADRRVIGTSGQKHAGEARGNSRNRSESLFRLSEVFFRRCTCPKSNPRIHQRPMHGRRSWFPPQRDWNASSGTLSGSSS